MNLGVRWTIGEQITYSRPVAGCTQPGGREIRTDADSTPLTRLSRAPEDQPRNGLKPECPLVVRASMSQGLCRSMSAQECLTSPERSDANLGLSDRPEASSLAATRSSNECEPPQLASITRPASLADDGADRVASTTFETY